MICPGITKGWNDLRKNEFTAASKNEKRQPIKKPAKADSARRLLLEWIRLLRR
jgi:hypothetical protein